MRSLFRLRSSYRIRPPLTPGTCLSFYISLSVPLWRTMEIRAVLLRKVMTRILYQLILLEFVTVMFLHQTGSITGPNYESPNHHMCLKWDIWWVVSIGLN